MQENEKEIDGETGKVRNIRLLQCGLYRLQRASQRPQGLGAV